MRLIVPSGGWASLSLSVDCWCSMLQHLTKTHRLRKRTNDGIKGDAVLLDFLFHFKLNILFTKCVNPVSSFDVYIYCLKVKDFQHLGGFQCSSEDLFPGRHSGVSLTEISLACLLPRFH